MKRLRPSLFLVGVLMALLPEAWSGTPADLGIQPYAGVVITGRPGTIYVVQAAPRPGPAPEWRAAAVVQLRSSTYLWVDTNSPASGQQYYRAVEGPSNLVWLEAGTFTMGSPAAEAERNDWEGPLTVVTLTHGFFIGRYEVTQGEYAALMMSNPSTFRNGTLPPLGGSGGPVLDETKHPVENVSWTEAMEYCAHLTEREQQAGLVPPDWAYRLPTEAEWEYACRAGTTTAFAGGGSLRSDMANMLGTFEYDSSVGSIANEFGIWLGRTTEVGSYGANGWDLFDMHGNVWELCWDRYSPELPGGRVLDLTGPDIGLERVVRGGSWGDSASNCRSAVRILTSPEGRSSFIGFRVVLAPLPR